MVRICSKQLVTWDHMLSCSKINHDTGCIEWQKGKANRYGVLVYKGKCVRAHRLSQELNNGPIPNGLCVLHRCDNPPCINPDHLFLGTQKDNLFDMLRKKRRYSKLTENQVLSVRSSKKSARELSESLGVAICTINQIRRRYTWKHLS